MIVPEKWATRLCSSLGANVNLVLQIAPFRVANTRGASKVPQRPV
jgi:hypothetical protein